MSLRWSFAAVLLFCALVMAPLLHAKASKLDYISDTLSIAVASTSASHVIQFTTTNAVPASGKIVITLQQGAFTVPATLDYTSVDLAVATSSGTFTDRTLASSASGVNDGVSVATGTNGTFTFTLNSTAGIGAGDTVRITIGTAASYQSGGTDSIVNPASYGSFHIYLSTKDAGGSTIESGNTLVATVRPVGVSATMPRNAAIIFDGEPSTTVPALTTRIQISVQTDLFAHCHYATTSGVEYANMTGIFGPTDFSQLSYIDLSGFQDNTTYTYYVRCKTTQGAENDTDYVFSFTIAPTPPITTSIGTGTISVHTGNLGPGGLGTLPNGVPSYYLSSVVLEGIAVPDGTVNVVQDGKLVQHTVGDTTGAFHVLVGNLERGTYTFELYSQDSAGRNSSPYTATISLTSGTQFTISSILIPPTIELSDASISPGSKVHVSGEGVPSAQIEVVAQKDAAVRTFSASTTAQGKWDLTLDTSNLPTNGAWTVKARVMRSAQSKSDFSKPLSLGVGVSAPAQGGLKEDMNHDGKVNLVDFSIFLLSWNTTDTAADFNDDNIVNLADFSMMLYYWTG